MYRPPDRVAAVDERDLLRATANYAADFLETLDERPVRAEADVEELTSALGGPLPEAGSDARAVLAKLVEDATPGVVGIPSGRYFGFVIGGSCPPRSQRTGSLPRGIRTRGSTPAGRLPRSSRRSPRLARASCSACRRTSRSRT